MTLHQTSTTMIPSGDRQWRLDNFTPLSLSDKPSCTTIWNYTAYMRHYIHQEFLFCTLKTAYTTFAIWLTFLYNHLTRPISTRQPPWAICHHLTPCIFTIPSRTPIYGSILFVYHLIFSIRPLYSRKETTWWHSTRRLSFSQETIGQWEMYFNEDSRAKISQGTTQ
jgi:hypothetical protein